MVKALGFIPDRSPYCFFNSLWPKFKVDLNKCSLFTFLKDHVKKVGTILMHLSSN